MPFGPRFGTLFVLLALAAPAKADAPLEFGAAVGTSWYEHTNLVPNSTFTGKSIRPWVRYDGPAGNWDLDGYAQHRLEFYSGRSTDSAFGGTSRHSNDRLEVTAVRRWETRKDLTLGASVIHAEDLFDPEFETVLPRGDVTRWYGLAGTHAGLYEASVRMRGTHYEDDPRLVDSGSLGWLARVVPVQRAIDEAFAGVSGRQLDVDAATELISIRPAVGYRRHILPTITAEVEAGAALNRFPEGPDEALPMIALGLLRNPDRGRALELESRLRLEGDSLAMVLVEGRYPIASGRLRLRAQSDAEAEGGYYTTANRTTEFATSVEDTLARANLLGLEGSYAVTRPLRGEGPSSDLVRATAWAVRRVQPWLDFRLAASYAHEFASSFRPPVRRVRLDAELNLLGGGFGRDLFGAMTGVRP